MEERAKLSGNSQMAMERTDFQLLSFHALKRWTDIRRMKMME